ncbi:MAG: hypothetical protein ABIS86_11700 [Streptosporangiaceae bacterium]
MSDLSAKRLGIFLTTAGVTHFVLPKPFDVIVPRSLPGSPRVWTHLSGIAEVTCGLAVLNPTTRRAGAIASAALFLAVLPANIKMARDWKDRARPLRAGAYARLPLQLPLIGWALKVARDAG